MDIFFLVKYFPVDGPRGIDVRLHDFHVSADSFMRLVRIVCLLRDAKSLVGNCHCMRSTIESDSLECICDFVM